MASPNRASQLLANTSVRHQVFLERLKRGQSKKAQAFLVEMDRALRLRIGTTELQRGRIEAQLSAIAADLRAIRGQADRDLLSDMRDLAEYEAGFEIRSLGTITTNFTVAAPTQVYSAALAKPLSLRGPGGGKLIEPFVRGWSDTMITNTIDTIRQGFFEGQTNAAILQAIRGTRAARNEDGLLARMSRSEDALVRTVVQHMASVAREEVWAANDDLVTGVQWLSVLDDRTTAVCRSLSGQIFPRDSGPRPPIHINCLPGDALITACGDVSGVSKRWFDGEIVTVKTANGRIITSTPNHPVLTRSGWVAAGLLDSSHQVVCYEMREGVRLGYAQDDNGPATVGDIAKAFFTHSGMRSIPVPVSAPDFHGDGAGSEVAIIGAYGGLLPVHQPEIIKHFGEPDFVSRYVLARGQSALLKAYLVNFLSANGGMGKASQALALLLRCYRHASELLLGPIAEMYASIAQGNPDRCGRLAQLFGYPCYSYPGAIQPDGLFRVEADGRAFRFREYPDTASRNAAQDNVMGDPELARYISAGQSGPVELDSVVDNERRRFSGHVYNLETAEGWYCVSGIVTHNCRSTTTPAIDPKFAFLSNNAQQSSLFGPVDAKETYYSWLKQQDAGFQDEAIGPMRAKLLRDGGLSAERFAELNLGKNFNPLTLDQMRKIEPLAFSKAGM